MLNYLKQLRRKPLYQRKRIMFASASVITAIIFLFWLATFSAGVRFGDDDGEAIEKELRPISEIKESVGSFYQSVKAMSREIFGSVATTASKTNTTSR